MKGKYSVNSNIYNVHMGDYASCNKAFGINLISIDKNETCEYNKSKKVRKSYCLKWRY